MSIHSTLDEVGYVLAGRPCFYCGRELRTPEWVVVWRGHGADVELHQWCAQALGAHLIKDGFGHPGNGSYHAPDRRRAE